MKESKSKGIQLLSYSTEYKTFTVLPPRCSSVVLYCTTSTPSSSCCCCCPSLPLAVVVAPDEWAHWFLRSHSGGFLRENLPSSLPSSILYMPRGRGGGGEEEEEEAHALADYWWWERRAGRWCRKFVKRASPSCQFFSGSSSNTIGSITKGITLINRQSSGTPGRDKGVESA